MLLAGKLVGDSLLSAAFVSYAGPFTIPFRQQLVTERWLPDLTQRGIPLTPGFMPLQLLTNESLKVSAGRKQLTKPSLWSCSCAASLLAP